MTTAAIRMGDGHVVHSCGDCEVEVPMGSLTIAHRFYVMDTEAFHFVLGTDFFVQHSQIQSLTLQAPYLLYVDHGCGRESLLLEQSEHTSSNLRVSGQVRSGSASYHCPSAREMRPTARRLAEHTHTEHGESLQVQTEPRRPEGAPAGR